MDTAHFYTSVVHKIIIMIYALRKILTLLVNIDILIKNMKERRQEHDNIKNRNQQTEHT